MSDLDLSKLHNEKIIVVNSSYAACPWADYLVFTDKRWWLHNSTNVRERFDGRVVTITPMPVSHDYYLLERQRSSGLALHPHRLALWHTTVTAAINLAVNLGAKTINLLGLDGKDRGDAVWHHEPHPTGWPLNANRYKYHGEALDHVATVLKDVGVIAYNANPESAHKMFPHRPFEEMTQ